MCCLARVLAQVDVVKQDWAEARVIALDEPLPEGALLPAPHNFRHRAAAVRQRSGGGEDEERLLLSQSQHNKRQRRGGRRYKCSVCGENTHNKRRCPERLNAAAAAAAGAAAVGAAAGAET